MSDETRPFSTHAWKGSMYESTKSCIEICESTWLRSWCSPSASVVLSIELAT
jgi:hypothetical protein